MKSKRLNLEEPGTLHRQAQAHRLGDRPEDAPSTETPGTAVRRYTVTDQISYLFRRGIINLRAYSGAERWKQDWHTSRREPKVTGRLDDAPRATFDNPHQARLMARRRFLKASEYLSKDEYAACFGVAILDEATAGRIINLRGGLWALADWYAVERVA